MMDKVTYWFILWLTTTVSEADWTNGWLDKIVDEFPDALEFLRHVGEVIEGLFS